MGRAVLLRLHATLQDVDPWALWSAQRAANQPFFLWNDGRMGLCAAAWGTLQEHAINPEDRFGAARALCSRLLEEVVDVRLEPGVSLDVDAPLAFAGFAFAPTPPQAAGPWVTWGGGRMYVPPVLVYRREQGRHAHTTAVLHTPIDADADPSTILAALRRQLGALKALRPPSLEAVTEPSAAASANGVAEHTVRRLEDRASWQERVEAARQAAQRGDLDKVVLARAAEFVAPAGHAFDVRATLFHLRRVQPRSICFAMGQADGTCFLGASPEILVQVFGRSMATQAVAGTAPRGATPDEDAAIGLALAQSAKDRREHAVVADVLRQALEPLCVELTYSPEPRLSRLPQVQHLETPFSGTLRQAGGILELVERLHPTPSVGGWPTAAALRWLAEHEHERGWYAGPVGWLTAAGDGAFAVAIRSVLLADDRALAYTGAGVVAASDPAAEWRETELKLRTVSDALQRRCRTADDESGRAG